MAVYLGSNRVGTTIVDKIGEKYGAIGSTFLGDVNANGVLQMPTAETNLVFNGVRNIASNVLQSFAYGYNQRHLNNIKTVSFPDLTTVSGSSALHNSFYYCTGITSASFPSLTTISGSSALSSAFEGCTGLTSVDLSSLTTISDISALSRAFVGCTGLTSVDLSSLTTVSGNSAMYSAFSACTGLTSVDLSSLTTISGSSALSSAFSACTSLTTLSFPSLTSTGFGSYTNQFNSMLSGVTGCTVHFPSNLQSVIGSWSSVTSGFGGTNTTILFDLPATT